MSHRAPNAVMLKKPAPPTGFETFWRRVKLESEQLPVQYQREHFPTDDTNTHRVERIRWQGADGTNRYGWYAVPHGMKHTLSGLLYLPGYGVSTIPVNDHIAFPETITLSPNLHGYPLEPNVTYEPHLGYLAKGIESPETYIYRRVVLDCLLVVRVLMAQPEVDATRVYAGGLSQGGGLAVILSAWSPWIQAAIAEMPFMTYWEYLMGVPSLRYPIKELTDYFQHDPAKQEQVLQTLQYYDTIHHAPLVRCPVQLSIGMKDPSIRVPVVFSLYEALQGPKRVIIYEQTGHDWTPEMRGFLMEWIERSRNG
jgi:cephalosporin-C deacetylase